ncbi:hypothetical protein NQ314_018062 [Rhamnusium bicolor]|uniref:Uncharacterized protein n=1 Tax=Rhamnusium bicolor TaxID=1586634 RepID=A0AAV8WS62_9CUCU|nr:hypothetical protein NQ314_018062 [Rhamnusium bicolor]
MAAVENPKFEELCRLCATKTTMVLAINIFENEGTIRQISKKICTCLPIQVHETDELPKMICENCLYKLELFCDFRERSARTERLLVELYKELNTTRAENDQEQTCLVPIDHNELIMVQHHQLLNDDNLQSVSEIDLTHLGQREGMIVEHEIILTHHNVDMNSHSLDSIDLNNHDLTNQDLSNHSFKTQESIMVDSSAHSIQDPQFTEDNLNLMQQHQLLSDQFRLQHLHINMGDDNSGNDVQLTNNEKLLIYQMLFQIKHDLHQQNQKYNLPDKSEYEDPKLEDNNSHSVDSHLNNIQLHNSYSKEINPEMEQLKHEDSNSAHSLLVDEQLNNVSVSNSISDKQVYTLNIENSESLVYLNSNKDWFYCNICGKSYEQKSEFEVHYETHFYKCTICLAVFTNVDVLNSHRKEAHGACVDDPKVILIETSL